MTQTSHPAHTKFTAIARGVRGRCPNCGEGKMFTSFLKVAENCNSCGEELNHHRADDLPAYLIIVILGHVLVPGVVWVEVEYSPAYWVHAVLWLPLTLALAIGLLQPCKGAVVATEWYLGLQGFFDARQRRIAASTSTNQ